MQFACFNLLCKNNSINIVDNDMNKRTKIVATIGPSSENSEILEDMIKSGMNVARINFSHGTHESNGKLIDNIRNLSEKLKIPVGIMADLQGPRIRVAVDQETEIKAGEHVLISDTAIDFKPKDSKFFKLDWDGIIKYIEIGNEILVEDGLMKMEVVRKEKDFLEAKVINGGTIKNHKGVNIPDTKLDIPILTDKDEKDLEYVLSREIDFVALSFVSNGNEINEVKDKIRKIYGTAGDIPQIVSKIERKEAIKNIDELVSSSDVIMVARGDLGIELPEAKVIIYQKEIIEKCLAKAKPVIVATQMLNSMIENPLPTRAEVSDVSNAVIDHADAVMLSGESANGKYPLKSIEVMGEIIRDTEESRFDDHAPVHADAVENMSPDYAGVIASAWKMADMAKAKAILAVSLSGFTARMISNYRPERPILVATDKQKTYRQLSLVWGVDPYLFNESEKIENYIELMIGTAKKEKKLEKGDKVVMVVGRPQGEKTMKLVGIKEIQ